MDFYTSFCEKRPIRLCEDTRKFAYESLYEHRYGLDTKSTPSVEMNTVDGFDAMSNIDKYDAVIRKIAEEAPVRICENERISGAATLGRAIDHLVPATYNSENIFYSISHLTIDFPSVLRKGVNGIKKEAEEALKNQSDERKKRFLESCINCIDSFEIWRKRYIYALNESGYTENAKILERVPFETPRNFKEAVQSIWFVFAFTRLCGNWPGIGRIDEMLGVFLKADLERDEITLEEAREILAHFFIKGCEWICGGEYYGGDAQHYQNLVIAGIDENGNEVTNEVTYLILDIIEELGISDFPTTARINRSSDERLIRRIAEVMRYGNGVLAVYNEDMVLNALDAFGYDKREALNFANDGCWEVQIPGKTNFGYTPFDSLAILQKDTLKGYADIRFDSFEELYSAYIGDLKKQVEAIYNWVYYERLTQSESGKTVWKEATPCTVISLFEDGCIEKGLSYLEGGAKYNIQSPHIGGVADTVNSLYVIKKLVFDEKKLDFDDFMAVLRENWEGNEVLRQYVLTRYELYGNDNDEIDYIAARLLDDFSEICKAFCNKCPIKFPAGVSTFGRQIEWAQARAASAHGRRKGEVLAGNLSPTPATAFKGATAIIKSHCKADLSKQTTGAALDIRLLPSDVKGENGTNAIMSLIKGFCALGGYFMQIDVADTDILKEAQKKPENYPSLAVRISGWNARFVTLSREWQDMVISNISGEAK